VDDINNEIELEYSERDYGYHVHNERGHATILIIHDTTQISYHVTALVYNRSYSASFNTPEQAHAHLTKLFSQPLGYHELYSVEEDRRASSLGSRIYRWLYRFMQC